MDQDNQTNQNPAPIDINNLGMDEIRESSTQATQPEHRVYDLNDIANADDSAYENVTATSEAPAEPAPSPAPSAPELERPELTREHLNALFATDLVEKSPNIATNPTEEPAPAAPATESAQQPASAEPQPAATLAESAPVDDAPLQIITAPGAKQTNVGLILIIIGVLLIGGGVAAYFAFFAN